MSTLLVLVLILALLLGQAAASNPAMDPYTYAGPSGSFYPDPDDILETICDICGISINCCAHALPNQPFLQPLSTFTPDLFYNHPDWPQDSLSVQDPALDLNTPLPPISHYDTRQPLLDNIVRGLDNNATTMQLSTIQVHLEGIYTPGDRTAARRPTHKRHAPRPGGFFCTHQTCTKVYDRSCDLKRHQKTHLKRSERPHKCTVCHEGFLYPKDRNRHQRTHEQSSSPQALLYCPVAGCDNVAGFSRPDNLLRHRRKLHPDLTLPS